MAIKRKTKAKSSPRRCNPTFSELLLGHKFQLRNHTVYASKTTNSVGYHHCVLEGEDVDQYDFVIPSEVDEAISLYLKNHTYANLTLQEYLDAMFGEI